MWKWACWCVHSTSRCKVDCVITVWVEVIMCSQYVTGEHGSTGRSEQTQGDMLKATISSTIHIHTYPYITIHNGANVKRLTKFDKVEWRWQETNGHWNLSQRGQFKLVCQHIANILSSTAVLRGTWHVWPCPDGVTHNTYLTHSWPQGRCSPALLTSHAVHPNGHQVGASRLSREVDGSVTVQQICQVWSSVTAATPAPTPTHTSRSRRRREAGVGGRREADSWPGVRQALFTVKWSFRIITFLW